MVYENSAEYPWAKFKDFIFSEDGKYIKKVLLVTESLIPVPYVVEFSDFQCIGDKNAVLRPEIKPSPGKIEKESLFLFSNLKKQKVKRNGHMEKFFDVNFDTEAGEIIDFIMIPSFMGRKTFISPGNSEFDELVKLCLKKTKKPAKKRKWVKV